MQGVITNFLLLVIAGGLGYLTAQWRPNWFRFEGFGGGMFLPIWIVALLLAGGLRAAAVVYGPEGMFAVISVVVGFILGIWLARRAMKT